jgi:hypothetical protein
MRPGRCFRKGRREENFKVLTDLYKTTPAGQGARGTRASDLAQWIHETSAQFQCNSLRHDLPLRKMI